MKQALLKLWEDVSDQPAGMHAIDAEKAIESFKNLNSVDNFGKFGSKPMRDALQGLMRDFVEIRSSTPYGTHPELWSFTDGLMFGVKALPVYKQRSYLKYSWSRGAGSWALVPWVAMLNKNETTTIEKGVHCVFLFREDMSGVYLCLSRRITALPKKLPKAEAYSELNRRADVIRSKIRSLESNNFVVGAGVDLRATRNLGYG